MPDAISLGEALKRFLDKSKIKPAIQSMQIEDHWEKVMGTTIAKFTDRIEIRNGTLFIYTQMAPLKNELVFQKELIVKRVNESMKETIVREVVVV
jgi:predicted nucleic acid-binding Zn ribbon protein